MEIKKFRVCLVCLVVCAFLYATFAHIHTRWTYEDSDDTGWKTGETRPVMVHDSRPPRENSIQARRQNLVARTCSKHNPVDPTPREMELAYGHVIVSEKYKALYCHAPKVATTSWRFMLFNATHGNLSLEPEDLQPDGPRYHKKREVHEFSSWTWLYELSPEERNKRLATYFKFMPVRHPLDRLISAFRDKFEKNFSIYQNMAEEIKTIYRPAGSPANDVLVTFNEFIQYIIDMASFEMELDHHWSTYQKVCQPCFIKYDYIAKVETMEEDAQQISELLGMTGVHLPKLRVQSQRRYKDYFQNDTRENYDWVVDRFRVDMEMFNYQLLDEPRYFRGRKTVSNHVLNATEFW